MQEEVLENACSVDIDVFRERLAGDKVQDCLKKHRKNIKAIYTVYAADDDSDGDDDSWEKTHQQEVVEPQLSSILDEQQKLLGSTTCITKVGLVLRKFCPRI